MSAISSLVEVSYKDMTNYNDVAGGDVMGTVLDYFWGPVNKLQVLTRNQFNALYPESLPFNKTTIDAQRYHAYAQIKKAFDTGIPAVEVIRIDKGYETYSGRAFTAEGTAVVANISESLPSDSVLAITTKYPGIPPKSLFDKDFDTLKVVVSCTDNNLTIDVKGVLDSQTETIESFQGSLDPLAVVDGQSIYIKNVVSESEIIRVLVAPGASISTIVESEFEIGYYTDEAPEAADFNEALEHFRDGTMSQTTMLISPVSDNSCDEVIQSISKERQDLVSVKGYPISNQFDKESILNGRGTIKPGVNFAMYVAGREIVSLFGQQILSNCIGGWCGATANVAKSVRINQLASAFSYGAYSGTLANTLSFSDVLELHENGVISVFTSNRGPLIWGVRALYSRQTSYYAKANVNRVLAAILRQWFPIALDAIHTDAASNPTTRANFDVRFKSVLDDMMAQENVLSDSTVTCMGDINSDVNTKGGKIFNVLASIHFIGLVEKVKIAIVATDSSVTAKIV